MREVVAQRNGPLLRASGHSGGEFDKAPDESREEEFNGQQFIQACLEHVAARHHGGFWEFDRNVELKSLLYLSLINGG